jgi:hypothetical protein
MTKLAELFGGQLSLKKQGEDLKGTVAWISYVAVVNRHQQIRSDRAKLESQIWRLVTITFLWQKASQPVRRSHSGET